MTTRAHDRGRTAAPRVGQPVDDKSAHTDIKIGRRPSLTDAATSRHNDGTNGDLTPRQRSTRSLRASDTRSVHAGTTAPLRMTTHQPTVAVATVGFVRQGEAMADPGTAEPIASNASPMSP